MSDEVDAALTDLEHKIARLRVLYEQYFIGIERAEPLVPRKDCVRIFAALQHTQIRNTALRFRYQTLSQRWMLLTARWQKTLREIEQGTYVRHLARAQRKGIALPQELARVAQRAGLRGPVAVADHAPPVPATATRPPSMPPPTPAAAGARPPPLPTDKRPPAPSPSPIPGMSDTELRALHQRYVKERGSEMKFEAMVATLQQQVPRILERHKCDGVRFDLHSQDGKVVLKGTPKR